MSPPRLPRDDVLAPSGGDDAHGSGIFRSHARTFVRNPNQPSSAVSSAVPTLLRW